MTARCDHDFLPGQCVPRCGLHSEDQVDAGRLKTRERLLRATNYWFPSAWIGTCIGCGRPYPGGAAVRRRGFDDGYLSDCCAKEDGHG